MFANPRAALPSRLGQSSRCANPSSQMAALRMQCPPAIPDAQAASCKKQHTRPTGVGYAIQSRYAAMASGSERESAKVGDMLCKLCAHEGRGRKPHCIAMTRAHPPGRSPIDDQVTLAFGRGQGNLQAICVADYGPHLGEMCVHMVLAACIASNRRHQPLLLVSDPKTSLARAPDLVDAEGPPIVWLASARMRSLARRPRASFKDTTQWTKASGER